MRTFENMKKYSGISMIEVIISMGIIALVLLSLLIYQISMNKNLFQTNLQNIATIQLMNFADMLRANTSDSQRDAALTSWNNDNVNLLPQGQGSYDVIDDHQCEINLNWVLRKQWTESILVYC